MRPIIEGGGDKQKKCQSHIDEYNIVKKKYIELDYELVTARNKLDRLYKYVSEVYVINYDYNKSQKESISDDWYNTRNHYNKLKKTFRRS